MWQKPKGRALPVVVAKPGLKRGVATMVIAAGLAIVEVEDLLCCVYCPSTVCIYIHNLPGESDENRLL